MGKSLHFSTADSSEVVYAYPNALGYARMNENEMPPNYDLRVPSKKPFKVPSKIEGKKAFIWWFYRKFGRRIKPYKFNDVSFEEVNDSLYGGGGTKFPYHLFVRNEYGS